MVKIFIQVIFLNFILSSSILLIETQAVTEEIVPPFGVAPKINGFYDKDENEWNSAKKMSIVLNSSQSSTDLGLTFKFWVMQNDSNLYIYIQYDLEFHTSREFVGILISENTKELFKEGKIIKFSDPSLNKSTFLDYYIDNNVFKEDTKSNGMGAAKLNGKTVTCEFSIPVNNTGDDNDVFLDYGSEYAFKIIYGETNSYSFSSGTKKSTIVQINVQYPPISPDETDWEEILRISCFVVFTVLGVLFGFYVLKIAILKKKVMGSRRKIAKIQEKTSKNRTKTKEKAEF